MENQRYKEEQYRQNFNATMFGLALTVSLNVVVALCCSFSGLKYLYPPPEEKTMVIDFEQLEEEPLPIKKPGREPAAEKADPEKETEYVQKSEAQHVGAKPNLSNETTVGPDGDVEVPEPPREEPIDARSLFQSAKNSDKDTLAAQTAAAVSDALKAGHPEGNTGQAVLDGTPQARVPGRNTVGLPAKPQYGVQMEGDVVVEIWVDRQGNVTKADAGADGTTVINKEMWIAARQAALKTKFTVKNDAPELVKGTITYEFRLQ